MYIHSFDENSKFGVHFDIQPHGHSDLQFERMAYSYAKGFMKQNSVSTISIWSLIFF